MRHSKFVTVLTNAGRMNCALSLLRLAMPALLLLLFAANAQAQFQATVQGTVTDAKGAVVADATVTLIDPATQIAKTTTTSGEGFYRFAEVAPGTYSVTVEAKGFEKNVTDHVIVSGELARGLDITLTIGQVNQSVTVDASTGPDLQTEEGNIEGTITNQEVQRLPSFGRDPYELLRFAPGVFGDGARSGLGLAVRISQRLRRQCRQRRPGWFEHGYLSDREPTIHQRQRTASHFERLHD